METRNAPDTSLSGTCPFCGGRLESSRGFPVDGERYAPCLKCMAYIVNPLPNAAALEVHYREEYYEAFGAQGRDPRRVSMFRRVLELMPRRPPGRLLDVGCGPGDFLDLARDSGWEVTGVDPSLQSCGIARREYGLEVFNCTFERAELASGRYDVVTLLNVLDQAPDPVRVLKTAHRVLRPGGLLVIRITNGGFHRVSWSIIRRFPRRMCRALRPLIIFHSYCLGREAIHAILAGIGLMRIRIMNAPVSGWASYFSGGGLRAGMFAFLASAIQLIAWVVGSVSAGRLLISPSLLIFAERETE